jgi:hypothetical protein
MDFQENEIIEMVAEVKDIDDSNQVVFQIWQEGQDPDSHFPYNVIKSTVKNGIAKAKWRLTFPEGIPADDPKFFFTAHSAWCKYKRSDLMTIKLNRPEIKNLQWRIDGNIISKAYVNNKVEITFDTVDIKDNATVSISIYDEKNDNMLIETVQGIVANDKVKADWEVKTVFDADYKNMKNSPEYYFIPFYNNRVNIDEKALLKLYGRVNLDVGDENDNSEYLLIFSDNTEKKCMAQNGMINLDDVPIGKVQVFHI